MNLIVVIYVLASTLMTLFGATAASESTFSVFWNAPSESCERRGIKLDLDKFQIKHNNQLKFKGSIISQFYADQLRFGAFPYVDRDGNEVNGGIPQRANLNRHWDMVKEEIEKSLPDDFDGLGVIAWQAWRPLFDRNWGKLRKYQRKSLEYVKKRFPNLSKKASLALAKSEWNSSAKTLFMLTLKLVTTLRPKAQWGFYKFPECYNYKAESSSCGSSVETMDDQLFWMWNTSSALFPSSYFGENYPDTFEKKKNLVRGHIEEAFRVGQLPNATLPVYFYMKYSYSSSSFATKEDLEASLQLASDLGAAGVILWDTSMHFRDQAYCSRIQTHMNTLLGPFAKRVIDEARECGASSCNSHGRCVLSDELNCEEKEFRCRCFNGWKGDSCQQKA